MNRPAGVTVIAVLCFLGAAFCVLGALVMLLGGGMLATILNQQSQASGAGAAGLIAGMGAAIGVVVLVFGAVYALVGWGLMGLKSWARMVTIVLTGIALAFQALGMLSVLVHFNVLFLMFRLPFIALDVWIIWYLLQPHVKAAFEGVQAGVAHA